MRGLLIVALIPGVAGGCKKKVEQAAKAPIELPCNYVPGAVRTYRSELTTAKLFPGAEGSMTMTSELRVEVLSYDGTTSVIGVRQGRPSFSGADPEALRVMETVNDQIPWDELTLRYATNHETGTHTIDNFDELMAAYAVVTDTLQTIVDEEHPEAAHALAALIAGLQNREKAYADVNDRAAPMVDHACGYLTFAPVEFSVLLPSPFGGPAFDANGREWTTEGEPGVVVVHRETEIDPQGSEAAVEYIATQMLPDDPEMQRIVNDLQVEMNTDLELVLPVATGWPTRWTEVDILTVSLGAMVLGSSTSTQIVTLVDAPAP